MSCLSTLSPSAWSLTPIDGASLRSPLEDIQPRSAQAESAGRSSASVLQARVAGDDGRHRFVCNTGSSASPVAQQRQQLDQLHFDTETEAGDRYGHDDCDSWHLERRSSLLCWLFHGARRTDTAVYCGVDTSICLSLRH